MEEDGAALVNASVTNDVIEEMFGAKLDNPDVDHHRRVRLYEPGPHAACRRRSRDGRADHRNNVGAGRRIHKVRIRPRDPAAIQ